MEFGMGSHGKNDTKALTKILRHWVSRGVDGTDLSRAVDETDLSEVTSIAVYETSFKRCQSYVTVIFDADKSGVIDVEGGRIAGTIIDFHSSLKQSMGIATGNCKVY